MGYYDTMKPRFDMSGAGGVGKAIQGFGDGMAKFAEVGQDVKKREKETQRLKNQAEGMKKYLQQNGIDTTNMSDDDARDNFNIHKATIDDNYRKSVEDGLISAWEKHHPFTMGKMIKNPKYDPDKPESVANAKGFENPNYTTSRHEKLARIKMIGEEQNNKHTPRVVKTTANENGDVVAVYDNGETKVLPFKGYYERYLSTSLGAFDKLTGEYVKNNNSGKSNQKSKVVNFAMLTPKQKAYAMKNFPGQNEIDISLIPPEDELPEVKSKKKKEAKFDIGKIEVD
jgi:hypothetical protein